MSAALMPVCQSGSAPWPASEDVAVSRMTVRGTRVWMAYRPDRGEWRRREAALQLRFANADNVHYVK